MSIVIKSLGFSAALILMSHGFINGDLLAQAPQNDKQPNDEQISANPINPKYILPTETFANIPFIEDATLSPNGKYIAGLFGIEGEQRIVMFPLSNGDEKPVVVGIPDGSQVHSIRWVNDDNIIASLVVLSRVQDDDWYLSRIIGVNRKTKEIQKLMWDAKGQNAADVLWIPSDGSNEILLAVQNSIYSNEIEFWPAVHQLNVETGKSKLVFRGKEGVQDWAADHNGNVRIGIGYNDRTQKSNIYYAAEGSKSLSTIDRVDLGEDENVNLPFAFVAGTDNGYMFKDDKQGRTGIAEVDLKSGSIMRWQHDPEDAEITSVITSYVGDNIIGIKTRETGEDTQWLEPNLVAAQNYINEAARNAKVTIESYNRDFTRVIAKISTPDNPGLFFIYDTQSQELAQFAAVNESIGNKRLSAVKAVQYKARDGLDIEGILTLPKGREPKNLPFIVMPHGGPWAHDKVSYDYWAQFLANRGYAVLQPNFRGSTGYGKEFLKKGEGQMGLAMQDDVSDGVTWAVEQGIADRDRVCIVGASYGGYAAMWGIIKDPDQYRCAISIAGVSHVRREVNDFGGSLRKNLFESQWEKMSPDFRAISPIYAAERIKAPLMLIHGKKDVTVNHKQSVIMEKAMQKAGKEVEFVSLPEADHFFTRQPDRLLLLKTMEDFLAKHNPAQ